MIGRSRLRRSGLVVNDNEVYFRLVDEIDIGGWEGLGGAGVIMSTVDHPPTEHVNVWASPHQQS